MMMMTMLRSAGVNTLEASPYSSVMVRRIMTLAILCVVVALPCFLIYNAAFTFRLLSRPFDGYSMFNHVFSFDAIESDLSSDQIMRQSIGSGCEVGGLYYLDVDTSLALNTSTSSSSNKESSTVLFTWHARLGHMSFSLLKVLLLELFENVFFESLFCNVC
ncbi:PREDICTED: uncharacterized protein LOC104593953 [Nelumbo nucifera]|uniref:Uncharacterized protein LOC104593953 n=1 Tax=Nelumbo nucifera TaxID=4432 RepID=A0A1U7ZKZ5_NELNU|nr:PREDICTED: uncharacterized protein LOC104593953 [Nelumbo nucifera]